jgi:hypothetical protein
MRSKILRALFVGHDAYLTVLWVSTLYSISIRKIILDERISDEKYVRNWSMSVHTKVYLYLNSVNPYWLPEPSDIEHVILLTNLSLYAAKIVMLGQHLKTHISRINFLNTLKFAGCILLCVVNVINCKSKVYVAFVCHLLNLETAAFSIGNKSCSYA